MRAQCTLIRELARLVLEMKRKRPNEQEIVAVERMTLDCNCIVKVGDSGPMGLYCLPSIPDAWELSAVASDQWDLHP